MALQTYSINMGMGPSGGQGCTHKSISLNCFCWVLGACIQQKKYYLSGFYYLPFSASLSVLKGLELSLFYSSVLFLSAFIKSASSLRKKLVFRSAREVWPWPCLVLELLLINCNCACAVHQGARDGCAGMFLWAVPSRQQVRMCAWYWAKSEDPFSFFSLYWGLH